ncbi:MAG: GAF domain-containing protein [Patescibacteria group bacterium]
MVREKTRVAILDRLIRLISWMSVRELKAISLRSYDPFTGKLKLQANWGFSPNFTRPELVGLKDTLSGQAFSRRTTFHEADIRISPYFTGEDRARAKKQGLFSTIALPLFSSGRTIGTIQLYFTEVIEMTEELERKARLLAEFTSYEMSGWLKDEADKRIIQAMVYENHAEALRILLTEVINLLLVERGVIYEKCGPHEVTLVDGLARQGEPHGLGQTFSFETQLLFLKATAENPQPYPRRFSLNVPADEPFLRFIKQVMHKNGVESIVVTPLIVDGEIGAYLVVDEIKNLPAFTGEDFETLLELSQYASILLTHYECDRKLREQKPSHLK